MIRTLVVDDDVMVAAVHCAYIDRVEGFSAVGEAHSGAEALAQVESLQPDLCLLDFYLPDLPGLEVARRLRTLTTPPVDTIIVTAARAVSIVHAAMQQGALGYLVKPFTFTTFRCKLERYAAYRARLERIQEADQRDVDQLYGLLYEPNCAALPKGFTETTLHLVEEILRGAEGEQPASEVAGAAGISRVTARRYLEYLCQVGRADLRLRYGTAGRPEHLYRLRGIRRRIG